VFLIGVGEDLKGDLDGGLLLSLRVLCTMFGYCDCCILNLIKVMSNF